MLSVAGCDTISGIFDSSDTPKLAGKRVSVLAVEQKLKVDKNLANVNVTLPEPLPNKDWRLNKNSWPTPHRRMNVSSPLPKKRSSFLPKEKCWK